jgi:S1-C subfamily serine protease
MKKNFAIPVTALVVALIAAVAFLWAGPGVSALVSKASASPVLFDEQRVVSMYEQVAPAVFQVNVGNTGQGSGFLIDADGYIVTNEHVVDGASEVEVVLDDGTSVEAEVLGWSMADDLALLKVDAGAVSGVEPLVLGDSDDLEPGQMAVAVGSPFGLDDTITLGIISGLERSLSTSLNRPISGVIQTDAAINPGNSGGPLLDSDGEVVGINTAIETSTYGSSVGIGFAVPVNTLKELLPRLKEGGIVRPPYLGISSVAIDRDIAKQLGLPLTTQGVYVVQVHPGSPAEEAGLVAGSDWAGGLTNGGDIITAVDGQPVASVEELVAYLNGKAEGDEVTLTVVRDGSTIAVAVTLGSWPEESPVSSITPPTVPDWPNILPKNPNRPFFRGVP